MSFTSSIRATGETTFLGMKIAISLPVAKFCDGSNEVVQKELLLSAVFRERGRTDLAICIMQGRKVQRLSFALGPNTGFHDRKALIDLFMGLKVAFDPVEEKWVEWRLEALEKWRGDELIPYLSPAKYDITPTRQKK
ncbi:hypothetical protein F4782DRAFT_552879 [Xylaria castorea]|nr:hypothetical protein F4782DRAFT_552879 [Xylaria castorea]